MTDFEGIWVPLVTPFRGEALDLCALQRLVEHLLRQGVDGLVVCGTTGEPATLSARERERVLAAVLEATQARVPVVLGLGGNDTRTVAHAARRARAGVAGLLVSAPYYTRPSQEGIRHHFEAVAAASELPLVLYNIPYRTGVNIELPTLRALSDNPRIVAIKESGGGNLAQLSAIIDDTPLRVLSGEDELIYVCACLGGHGAIAAAAHIRPDLYRRMLEHVLRGELAAAREIQRLLLPLIRLLFSEPNPAVIKAALAVQGLIGDGVRLPMTRASAEVRERLGPVLERVLAFEPERVVPALVGNGG